MLGRLPGNRRSTKINWKSPAGTYIVAEPQVRAAARGEALASARRQRRNKHGGATTDRAGSVAQQKALRVAETARRQELGTSRSAIADRHSTHAARSAAPCAPSRSSALVFHLHLRPSVRSSQLPRFRIALPPQPLSYGAEP